MRLLSSALLLCVLASPAIAQPGGAGDPEWPPKISPDGYSIIMQDYGIEAWESGQSNFDKVWTEIVVGSPQPNATLVVEMWVRDYGHPEWAYKLVMSNVINTGPNGYHVGYMFGIAPTWFSLPTIDSVLMWGYGYDVKCRVKNGATIKASDAQWINNFAPYPG